MKYIILFLFIAVNLAFAEYDPINKDERLIENGVFVGKKDSYSYFEIEAYGVWIEKKYKKDEWNRIAEYRDYLEYLDFLESYYLTRNDIFTLLPENKLTPKIKATREKAEQERLAKIEAERLAREKAERERFTIRSATFIDNKTGYMWEKPKIVGNWNWDSLDDRYNFAKKYGKNWNDAKSYCENLNLEGYSDWKLPSRDELHTLMTVNYGEYNSGWQTWFINNKHKRNNFLFVPEEISNFMVPWIWTRNISENYNSGSWVVYFNLGYDSWNLQTSSNLVLCVRDL